MKTYLKLVFLSFFISACSNSDDISEDIQNKDIKNVQYNQAAKKRVAGLKPDKSPPNRYKNMRLVWNEEFETSGNLNPDDWNFEKGFVRNQELQWYQESNAYIKNHVLVIEGRKENIRNVNYEPGSTDWKKNRQKARYTSASVTTEGKHSWLHGRIEIRARIPSSRGAWPAIWTLGNKGEWPSKGEIDILELYRVDSKPTILANFAWAGRNRWQSIWNGSKKKLSEFSKEDENWIDKFHVWRMDWDSKKISIYLDGELLNEHSTSQRNYSDEFGGVLFPYQQEHYLLLNLAIGANGGNPSKTEFPLKYEIDYIRVYQN